MGIGARSIAEPTERLVVPATQSQNGTPVWGTVARSLNPRSANSNVVLRPNPSVEARPNGRPPGPGRWYAVHFHRPGPGVPPLVPPHLKR